MKYKTETAMYSYGYRCRHKKSITLEIVRKVQNFGGVEVAVLMDNNQRTKKLNGVIVMGSLI